jgi:hypothetical protein
VCKKSLNLALPIVEGKKHEGGRGLGRGGEEKPGRRGEAREDCQHIDT